MSRIGHNFPPMDGLPIPEDVQPGPGWTDRMVEMADHIGAYRTLLLVERFGGMRIYIPAEYDRGKVYEGKGSIRDVIGEEAAQTLSRVYRREFFQVPTARHAIARARRQGIIASVRARRITASEASRILGTSRTYLSHLVNQTEEGCADGDPPPCPRTSSSQMDLFGDE